MVYVMEGRENEETGKGKAITAFTDDTVKDAISNIANVLVAILIYVLYIYYLNYIIN